MNNIKLTRGLAIAQIALGLLQIIPGILYWIIRSSPTYSSNYDYSDWFGRLLGFLVLTWVSAMLAIAILTIAIIQIINGSKIRSGLALAAGITGVVVALAGTPLFMFFVLAVILMVINLLTLILAKPKISENPQSAPTVLENNF